MEEMTREKYAVIKRNLNALEKKSETELRAQVAVEANLHEGNMRLLTKEEMIKILLENRFFVKTMRAFYNQSWLYDVARILINKYGWTYLPEDMLRLGVLEIDLRTDGWFASNTKHDYELSGKWDNPIPAYSAAAIQKEIEGHTD